MFDFYTAPSELLFMQRRVGRVADGLEGRGQRLGRVVQVVAHAARARRELVARAPPNVRRGRSEGRHGRGPALYNGRGHGRRLAKRPGHVGALLRVAVDAALGRDLCANQSVRRVHPIILH